MKKLAFVLLFMFSCGFPNLIESSQQDDEATQAPITNPTSIPIQPDEGGGNTLGAVLYSDDFSDSSSGWDIRSDESGSTDYVNGQYFIQINEEQLDVFSNPGSFFAEGIRIEVEAIKIGGDDDNDFGIICRYRDPQNYYYFVISSDGFFAAYRVINGETSFIGEDGWDSSSAINLGAASNTIRVDCVGSTFRLYANGTLLREVQDATFIDGDVGLIAGTFDVPGTTIAFDNFVVYAAE